MLKFNIPKFLPKVDTYNHLLSWRYDVKTRREDNGMFGRWWNAVSGDPVKRNSPYSDFYQSYLVPPGGGLHITISPESTLSHFSTYLCASETLLYWLFTVELSPRVRIRLKGCPRLQFGDRASEMPFKIRNWRATYDFWSPTHSF